MRLLFVGSNPVGVSALPFAELINEIEENLKFVRGDVPKVNYLPHLAFNDLSRALNDYEPDILHITAHGETDYLEMSSAKGDKVGVSGPILSKLLPSNPPRLVFLSACNAVEVAKSLSETVAVTIGCSTTIKGMNARHTSIIFLQRILMGETVAKAFNACKAFLEAAQEGEAEIHLFARKGVHPEELRLFQPLEITAKFEGPTRDGGQETILLGVMGAPGQVRQVVFFTDDTAFLDGTGNPADGLCQVTLGTPKHGRLWAEKEWGKSARNFQIFCSCVGSGQMYSASSTLVDALARHYEEDAPNPDLRAVYMSRISKLR